jgi:hydroxymethylbilane synthase
MRTSGDRIRDRALAEAGGKGLFTKEIEAALLSGAVDIAVHSAKDMQTFLPPGLAIGAVLPREDVRDALIARSAARLDALPPGARIGTASLRRQALLRRARPDLEIALLRGNVPTRVQRIERGEFDAALLAAAGLRRLGLDGHIAALLPLEEFPPACGQGAIAIECRDDDMRVRDLLAAIDHSDTARAVLCERAFLAVLDGSCRTPIAGYARIEDESLVFDGIVLAEDGREFYQARRSGAPADAGAIGREAGEEIRRRAPAAFLARLGIA